MSTVESRFVEVHGRPAHYLEAGRGPQLLLLHGAVLRPTPTGRGER